MPTNTPTPRHRMLHLPGYYFDPVTNRYYKGTRPPPPPPRKPSPPTPTTLPKLLRAAALGNPTTYAKLHATLLRTSTPNKTVTPRSTNPPPIATPPTEAFAHKPYGEDTISVLAFPDGIIHNYYYASMRVPISLSAHGSSVAYAASDGVFVHQIHAQTQLRRKYRISANTVSLSEKHILIAGKRAKIYSFTSWIWPHGPVKSLAVREVLCSHMLDPSCFALGTRDGRVVLADKTEFYPSGRQRSLTAVKIHGNLVWCSAMRGGNAVTAWDMRDLSSAAIVCKGQVNLCKMVGLDAADTLAIAGGDDGLVRVWDVRGADVLCNIPVRGIVKRVKMAGWNSGATGKCGVWLDTGRNLLARVVST